MTGRFTFSVVVLIVGAAATAIRLVMPFLRPAGFTCGELGFIAKAALMGGTAKPGPVIDDEHSLRHCGIIPPEVATWIEG